MKSLSSSSQVPPWRQGWESHGLWVLISLLFSETVVVGAWGVVVVAGAAVVVLRLVKGRLVVVGRSVVNAEVGDIVVVVGVVTDATVVVVVVKKGTAERPEKWREGESRSTDLIQGRHI